MPPPSPEQASSLTLNCGVSHFLTIRATNCRGLVAFAHSVSAKLCCSDPVAGGVELSAGDGNTIHAARSEEDATVSWEGFSDSCSGVATYHASLRAAGSDHVIWNSGMIDGDETLTLLPLRQLRLSAGVYAVAVRATNGAGHSVTSEAELMVDLTPPSTHPPLIRLLLGDEAWQQPAPTEVCSPATHPWLEVHFV